MNIIVCIKSAINPSALVAGFSISSENKVIPPKDSTFIIDPASETALELALKLKDAHSCKITALSAGCNQNETALKKAIAMGADDLVLIDNPSLEGASALKISEVLSKAITKMGDYSLILCGLKSADWGLGITAPSIAEMLSLPLISDAEEISFNDNEYTVKHHYGSSIRGICLKTPAVLSVGNKDGKARRPGLKGTMAAKKATAKIMRLSELSIGNEALKTSCSISNIKKPEIKNGGCEFISAETPEETAEILLGKLREKGLL